MTYVFDNLKIISKEFEDTTFKIIAKRILENADRAIFCDQEELAAQTFVSISTITKFAKKMGFSGFRELNFKMKNEWRKLDYERKEKMETFEIFQSIEKWIHLNEDFINTVCEKIRESDFINIYTSYQANESSRYFANMLYEYEKNVTVLNNEFRFKAKKNNEKGFNLLILTGRDNDTLIDNFSKAYDENYTNFLISSDKQIDKLNFKFTKKMTVDYSLDNSQFSSREVVLHMLFFYIFKKI
ncbi:MurR/RpiR family transcriptional regulator [Spiroplasma cantharicola]|uniref:HTH rpiR-type domain-containing protein n=1 Tax=Spiroplasma cantharicola TaxID=362837 RepID=A0A0M4JWU5_9MOLU|nr:MurR/RpiR family transcriptional regulator [Spiroplasma cantharicola]ALD66480.1 hypothetical protein SCANT_v1c05740 [Spiroplasma cantharicola]